MPVPGLRRDLTLVDAVGIGFGAIESFATPRRLAVRVADVGEQQPAQTQERLGPALQAALKDGQPTAAGLGFAKSCGVEFAELGEKDGKLHFIRAVAGQATAALIGEIFEDTLKQMDALVPKRMRWSAGRTALAYIARYCSRKAGSSARNAGLAKGDDSGGDAISASSWPTTRSTTTRGATRPCESPASSAAIWSSTYFGTAA